jgi:hypothetical protein
LEHSICSLFLIYLATRMALLVLNVWSGDANPTCDSLLLSL